MLLKLSREHLYSYVLHIWSTIFVDENRDKVVDFHWNVADPWTIVSVSDDGESTGGGGTLQVTSKLLVMLVSFFYPSL